jgi:hypothetical protein
MYLPHCAAARELRLGVCPGAADDDGREVIFA